MRDLWFVAFLAIAIVYTIRRPYLGVAAWVWIALIAPTDWAFGFSQQLRPNLTIVVVCVFAYMFSSTRKAFPAHATTYWVALFAIWTLISSLFTLNDDGAWVLSYWFQFAKIVLLFLFVTLTLRSRLQIEVFVWAMVLSISSYAGMEGTKFILSGGSHNIVGVAGIIADRNDLAVAINMCVPLIVYMARTTRSKGLRIGLWILLALNITAIVGTGSRGGFIGLAILAVAFWLTSKRKLILAVLALMCIPLMYQAAPDDWRDRQATIATAATDDNSFIGRLWAWKISTMIALDNPVTGGGFRAVTQPRLWNFYAPATPDFSMVSTPEIPTHIRPKAAHNIYFQVLGDHGFVGLFIFLAMLASALLSIIGGARIKVDTLGEDKLWYKKLSNAIVLSMIGYGITGANVSLAYFDLLYAFLGLIVVMGLHREELIGSSRPHKMAPHPAGLQYRVPQTWQ